MYIRKANQPECDVIKTITINTITAVYPHYYQKGAVEFFLNLHNDAAIKKDLEDNKVYVPLLEDKIIATITINQNEINRFFVSTDYQKHGYGSQILDIIEKTIFEKYDSIQLHAALPGKSLYLKRGYQPIEFRKREVNQQDWLCIDILEKRKF